MGHAACTCGHAYEHHAWDEDDAYCTECSCIDYEEADLDYEEFRQQLIQAAGTDL